MPSIYFLSEGIKFIPKNKNKLRIWIRDVIELEGRGFSSLVYIFCPDTYLLKINRDYLNHQTLTDIITFNYSDGRVVDGEIYISVERVRENAIKFQTTFDEELHRVMIHGVLHLLGYKDKTTYHKSRMRKKEEACLSLLN